MRCLSGYLRTKSGIAMGAGREKVRVAYALNGLPQISSVLRGGRVSFSKVRAMNRVAKPQNEDYLLMIADRGTASHVERLVRNYCRVKRSEALERDNQHHALRELNWYIDNDGSYRLKARLSPEQGARIAQALDAAMAVSYEEQRYAAENVSAETSRRLACDCGVVHWLEDYDKPAHATTLDIGRRTRSIPPAIRRALQRRDGGCCFPGCTAQRHVDAHHVRHWADGGATRLDNLLLPCRHHHRLAHEGGYGLGLDAAGEPVFTAPNGNLIQKGPDIRFRGNVFAVTTGNQRERIEIGRGWAAVLVWEKGGRWDGG